MDYPAAERPLRGGGWRRPVITLVVLLLLAGAVWGAWALSHRAKSGPGGPGGLGGRGGFRGPPTTVGVATATVADIPITLEEIGTVTPVATVTVRPQVSGTITEILFKEGQMVRKGQTLAVIDQRPFQMALLQAQGNLARDQAQLANAEITLGRDRTLLAQDSIARQDVDTQEATVRQLQGTVTADKAAVGTAQLNLGYSKVVAPVAGRVGLRQVDIGNYVGAGSSSLVVLTQVSPIDAVFTIPQEQVPQVQARAARSALPVIAFDQTRTVQLSRGTFSTLDNQVDATTGTVKAKARFENADGALFPSQFVNVRLQLDTLRNVVVVPPTAVRTGPRGQYVWVLQANRTVMMRQVTTGPNDGTEQAITSGLNACEQVITEGADRLTQGARVMLPGDRPPAGGFGGRGGHGGRRGGRGGQGGFGAQGGFGGPGAGHGGFGGAAQGPAGAPAAGCKPPAGGQTAQGGFGRHGRGGFGQGQGAAALQGAAGGGQPREASLGGQRRFSGPGGQGGFAQGGQGFQGPPAGAGQGAWQGRGGFHGRGGWPGGSVGRPGGQGGGAPDAAGGGAPAAGQ